MLRNPSRAPGDAFGDTIHPNDRGHGEIAQELFMRMAFSPEYMERQAKILKGEDEDWNAAVWQTAQQQLSSLQ